MEHTDSERPFTTPVLFLIFCRPETTRRVFEVIREVRPTKLYIAADGPRDSKPGEAERCEATRQIAMQVDWECEVSTLFRENNVGLGKGLSSAITWFFEHETEGIILEDDCLPSPSFFSYCAEMLERYRDDARIMEIGGNNLEKDQFREKEYSYSFSNLVYIWGWATWRRAWKFHDYLMEHYGEINEKRYLTGHYSSIYEQDFFEYVFDRMNANDRLISRQNVWSYQWQFACKINSGLVVVPNRNLVVNLGIGGEATNTTSRDGLGSKLKLEEMEFPLKHPEFVMVNRLRVKRDFRAKTSFSSRVRSGIKRVVPRPLLENVIKPLMHVFSF